ncbi:MAG: GtrA family protein [Pseudomonadota bacterium]
MMDFLKQYIFNQHLARQGFRFLFVGLLATVIQYFILWILVKADWCSAPTASGIGYIISAGFNYLLNYFFTFHSNALHVHAGKRFIILVLVGWLFTYALMHYLITSLNLYYFAAQLLTTGIILVLNFVLSRFWIFKVLQLPDTD